jgi:glycosyltransferase involved in cell wall biosynthesis
MTATGPTAGLRRALTVVVPTRDRPAALAQCLDALAAQTAPAFEVVVVDDGSADAHAVAGVVAAHPAARLVVGEGRGPAAARNLGVRVARTPVVCFTDDDCRPGPDWLAALGARLAAGARVVAGPTVVAERDDPYAVAAQTITDTLLETSRDAAQGTVGFAPTSNLAAEAALLRDLPFDDGYPRAAGEDREWCDQVARRGIAIAYAPTARVEHAPALGLRGFWRQQVRYGRGAHRYHGLRRGDPTRRAPRPGPLQVRLLRAGAAQGVRIGALVALAQAATALGVAAEARDQARSRRGAPGRSG